jgi:hypothetical protein
MFYRLLSDFVHIRKLFGSSVHFISYSLKWPVLNRPTFSIVSAFIFYRAI